MTNELEERQHRWSQIESLCALQIVPRTAGKGVGDTASGSRPRTSSAIAQALANVANIGGVGSGRKISSDTSPWMASSQGASTSLEQNITDLPPTYSSTIASINSASSDLPESSGVCTTATKTKNKTASVQLPTNSSVGSFLGAEKDLNRQATPGHESIMNGHAPPLQPHNQRSNATDWIASRKGSGVVTASGYHKEHGNPTPSSLASPDCSVEDQTVTLSSNPNLPAGARSKKRLSWFGSGKKDFPSESDSADNDEERRKKKVKWMWRSAVRKSSVHKMQNLQVKADGMPRTSSSEKLKAG